MVSQIHGHASVRRVDGASSLCQSDPQEETFKCYCNKNKKRKFAGDLCDFTIVDSESVIFPSFLAANVSGWLKPFC